MNVEIIVSLVGALVAILVSVISSYLANRNNKSFQNRKLKEEHYVKFIEAMHNSASKRNYKTLSDYTFYRDKMFIIASQDVVIKLIEYEEIGIKEGIQHDKYYTELIKAIREDLGLKNNKLPEPLRMKKA